VKINKQLYIKSKAKVLHSSLFCRGNKRSTKRRRGLTTLNGVKLRPSSGSERQNPLFKFIFAWGRKRDEFGTS